MPPEKPHPPPGQPTAFHPESITNEILERLFGSKPARRFIKKADYKLII
ncbi:hypothetical protein NIASO_13230 [Niabella soli DSM 19437]|uniref:Uncharacterized protein n=1 Tax=Niabella soli DSM 19437 TaxID=929713 RepID=W0F7F3_9BACT|nr:hypothetical protein NIASO_13230 [Niabella soli DSM 19437]